MQKKSFRQLREEAGLTREEMAVQLHTTFPTIINIELGRSKPRVELAERIYLFFGVPIGSIEWGKPEKATDEDASH